MYLKSASKAFTDWKSARSSNTRRKASSGFQNFLCTFADFLESFSGIAEIIKAADQQFGGLAFGTVALLLAVAAHKQRTEEAIEEALEELSYAFPRLETLLNLKPNYRLHCLIVDVFKLVIYFCRETVEYMTHARRRLRNAICPKPMKMKTLSRLRITLGEIRKECEDMMLKQLHDIQNQLGRLEVTGDDTNNRVREGQAWMSKSNAEAQELNLFEIRKMLRLTRQDVMTTSTIAEYKSVLTKTFADRRRKNKTPRMLSWDVFQGEPAYSAWLEQSQSSMLILGGSNWLVDSSVQLNWLSYASVLVAESTTKPLLFFCQTNYTVSRRLRRCFSDIVRSLVYQLVERHPNNLQAQRQDITEALESPEWQDNECAVAFEVMAELLIKTMVGIDRGAEIVIVIDRLDQCRWSDDPENDVSALDHAVGSLLAVVRDPSLDHLRIKMLLVMDPDPAGGIANKMDWAKLRGSLHWRIDWDQEGEHQEH